MHEPKFKVGDYLINRYGTGFTSIFQVKSIENHHPAYSYCIYNLKIIKYHDVTNGDVCAFNSAYIEDDYVVCRNVPKILANVV